MRYLIGSFFQAAEERVGNGRVLTATRPSHIERQPVVFMVFMVFAVFMPVVEVVDAELGPPV